MVTKIDHIGIIVQDIKRSLLPYKSLLKLNVEECEEFELEGAVYRLAFLSVGGLSLELVETSATNGLAAEFLREHGEGIHHIAFEVDDLERTFRELQAKGVGFVWNEVKDGAKGSKVAYFRPEEFNGIYIELVQKNGGGTRNRCQ